MRPNDKLTAVQFLDNIADVNGLKFDRDSKHHARTVARLLVAIEALLAHISVVASRVGFSDEVLEANAAVQEVRRPV